MSTYRSEDIEELLGVYALDAVDSAERRAVEAYLATNPRARAEVEQHREVATLLAFTGAPAPEGLWDRIAGSLDERAPAPGPALAPVLSLDRPPRRRRGRAPLVALGAVAAAIIVVLGFVVVDQSRELDRLRPQAVDAAVRSGYGRAMADPTAKQVELVSDDNRMRVQAVVEPDGVGYLAASSLPALPADRAYQLWGVIDDEVISLGLLGSRPEIVTFWADGELTALVITVEESGGVSVSEQPATVKGELA